MSSNTSMPVETEALIGRLLSEDPIIKKKAWDALYLSYYRLVRDFVVANNGSDQEATDIFQDTLVIFLRNLKTGSFRKEASLKTYIFSISRNLWMNELARQKKVSTLDRDGVINALSPTDNNYLMTIEVIGLLMSELKEDCRQILTEYYYNNKSMSELKDLFHVNSVQAAKNKKWRCLSYLIKLFKERSPIRIRPDF